MKLYHFTALEKIKAIFEEGLVRGDVPLSPEEAGNGVWLTRNPDAADQGWAVTPRKLTAEERQHHERIFGRKVPRDARFPDKRAIALEVEVPEGDDRLHHWPDFALGRLDPAWY